MRTKEFLSARGVDYESINVADDSRGLELLRSLGARGVPVVSRDDEYIYSQDLNAEAVPARERNPDELYDHAGNLQEELLTWLQGRGDRDCNENVNTFYGPQSLHAVLERCTWHSTQHIRQLMMVLDTLGITPQAPLTEADLQGLPLPKEIWDS